MYEYFFHGRRELMVGFRGALSLFNFNCRIMEEQCLFVFNFHIFCKAVSFPRMMPCILCVEYLVELIEQCRQRCRALLACFLCRLFLLACCIALLVWNKQEHFLACVSTELIFQLRRRFKIHLF